jgi:hypothetical protein
MPGFEAARRQLQREIDAGIVAQAAHPDRAALAVERQATCAECSSPDLSLGSHDHPAAVCAACGAVQAV